MAGQWLTVYQYLNLSFFDKVCDFIVCNLIDVGVYGIKLSPLESMSDSVLVRRCEDKLTILSCL